MNAYQLAVLFHDTYERLAPSFGYATREDTREFSPDSINGKLMIAVCEEINLKLQAENAKLRACVELYADVNSWNSTGYIWLPTDKGYEPAQECLEELK